VDKEMLIQLLFAIGMALFYIAIRIGMEMSGFSHDISKAAASLFVVVCLLVTLLLYFISERRGK
jgi:hypothetical protein